MFQQILIGIIFLAAVVYVMRMIVRSFQAKSGCATNCGKCSTIDVDKIEKQIHAKASLTKSH